MRFPSSEQLSLPCTFAQLVPGRQHPDGRRYLPLIVLRLADARPVDAHPAVAALGVVDRHHVVDLALEGRAGVARLVFLLSGVRLQAGQPHFHTVPPELGSPERSRRIKGSGFRQGLVAEEGLTAGRASTAPTAYGRVVAVPAWEAEREHLPYESLYTELLLDIGVGIIGVRTSVTAASLAETIGKSQIEPGDWLEVRRSRVDMLAFEI
ncbi:MAG: hypothetical protein M3R61_05900 [Chloroflexota bacterium]|nr:hypothetical protein [Chloroflexota bacterium]